MARFYGQNIEISLNQCHVYIHPFILNTSMLCTIKDVRCNLMQGKDVRKTKRRGSQSDTSLKRCSITQTIFVKTKRCAMKRTEMRKRK